MINLRLPPEVYAAIKELANSQGISPAAYLARLATTHAAQST